MNLKEMVEKLKRESGSGGATTPVKLKNVTPEDIRTYESVQKKFSKTAIEGSKTAIDPDPLLNILTPSLSETLTQPSYRSVIRVGPSVILMSIRELGMSFGLPPNRMIELVRSLDVPTLGMSGELYVNLPSLEASLFQLLSPAMWKDADQTMIRSVVGMVYGSLSADAVKQKVAALAKALTKTKKSGKMRRAQ